MPHTVMHVELCCLYMIIVIYHYCCIIILEAKRMLLRAEKGLFVVESLKLVVFLPCAERYTYKPIYIILFCCFVVVFIWESCDTDMKDETLLFWY